MTSTIDPVAVIEAVASALGGEVVRPPRGADPTRYHIANSARGQVVVSLAIHEWAGLLFSYGTANLMGKLSVSLHTDTGVDSRWQQSASSAVICEPLCPPIRVSLERAPEAIAADISRRLLPGYAEYLAKLEPEVRRVVAAKAQERKRVRQLMVLLGADPTRQDPNDPRVYSLVRGRRTIATLGAKGETVDLSLSEVPYETAVAMLRLMMESYRIPEPCADLVS